MYDHCCLDDDGDDFDFDFVDLQPIDQPVVQQSAQFEPLLIENQSGQLLMKNLHQQKTHLRINEKEKLTDQELKFTLNN